MSLEALRFVTSFVGLPLAYVNLKFNSILVPLRATMVRIAVLLRQNMSPVGIYICTIGSAESKCERIEGYLKNNKK
jgi:hypothetical protein